MHNCKSLTAIFFSVIIVLYSCHRNGDNETFPVCESINDSSFSIRERVGINGNDQFFDADTIVASTDLTYLTANDSLADEYIWSFSSSPQVFFGRSVGIVFNQPIGTIQINLTVKRSSTNPCFGTLSGESVYSKKITIVDGDDSPLLGSYYGYNSSDKSNYFSIQILRNGIKNIPFKTNREYYLQNEVVYGSSAFYIAGSGTYDPEYGAYATNGFGYLLNNSKDIKIDYSYKKPVGASGYLIVKDTFYGIKQ